MEDEVYSPRLTFFFFLDIDGAHLLFQYNSGVIAVEKISWIRPLNEV